MKVLALLALVMATNVYAEDSCVTMTKNQLIGAENTGFVSAAYKIDSNNVNEMVVRSLENSISTNLENVSNICTVQTEECLVKMDALNESAKKYGAVKAHIKNLESFDSSEVEGTLLDVRHASYKIKVANVSNLESYLSTCSKRIDPAPVPAPIKYYNSPNPSIGIR